MTRNFFLILFLFFLFLKGYTQPTNIDFSTGNLNGWTFEEAGNLDSYLMSHGSYSASLNYALMMAGVLEINNVPVTMTSPLGGKFMRIGNTTKSGKAYKLSQTFNVDANSEALSISYAIVTKAGNKYCNENPYFYFVLKDNSGNIIPNSDSYVVSSPIYTGAKCLIGDPSFSFSGNYDYKNWVTKNFSLKDYAGTNVTVEFIASGSTDTLGAYPLYAYVDAAICNNSFSPNILSVNTNTYNLLQTKNDILVCGTTTATIAAPSGATSYSWTGTGVNGLNTQSVAINQKGVYQVVFNKASACSNTTSVSFTIAANPTITVSSLSNTVCAGSVMTMTATGAKNYVWSPFFNESTGANTNFSSAHKAYPYTSTTYSVLGIDTSGCTSSAQIPITVIVKPTFSVSGNTFICLGNTATLTATGTDTYSWSPGNMGGSAVTVSPNYNTIYTVTGVDAGTGCATSKTINVIVDRNIQDNILNKAICFGDSTVLTASGATSYTWSNGVTTNTVTLKPTSTTVYTLNASTLGCGVTQKVFTVTVNPLPNVVANATQTYVCSGKSIKLYGSGASTYQWSNSVANNVYFIQTSTTTYSVIGTNSYGCKKSASITVSVVPSPTINVSASSSLLCLGQTATLSVTGANTYTWNTGENASSIVVAPNTSGTFNYNVSGSNTLSCVSNSMISISVYSAIPTFSFASSTATVCNVATNTISIYPSNGGAMDVFSCNQPNTTCSPSKLVLNPSPSVATIYTVTATNGCGVQSHTVQVLPQSLPLISISSPDSVCVGAKYSYSVFGADLYKVNNSPSSTTTYTFSTTNTFTAVAPTNTFVNIFIAAVGQYYNGCIKDTGKYIKVLGLPNVRITGNGTLTCSSCTTNLTGIGASTYTWNTGAVSANLSVFPITTTDYTVTGTGVNGCSWWDKTTVVVMDSLTMCFNHQLNLLGNNFQDVNTADFNGDGKMDIVATNTSNIGLSLYMNNGNGSFSSPNYFGQWTGLYGLCTGDINNDGAADVVVPNNTFWPDKVTTYLNDGNGNLFGPNTYTQDLVLNTPRNIFSMTLADLSGDGYAEIITGNVNGIVIYNNTGSGTFNTRTSYFTNGKVNSMLSDDINQDGKKDLIAVLDNDTTLVMINNGSSGFLSTQKYPFGGRGVLCDVNTDGSLDLVTATNYQKLTTTYNNGSGVFTTMTQTPIGVTPAEISAKDFNGDGLPDIALTSYGLPNLSNYISKYIKVYVNTGNGLFHSPVNYYPSSVNGYGWFNLLTEDFNSDSKPDLTGITYTKDSIFVMLNSAAPLLTITPQTNSVVCAGSAISLTASGANTYTWSGGISNGILFNPTQTQSYTVNATDNSGCSGYAAVKLSVSPNLSIISPNPVVCGGNAVTLTANGADSYTWSTGENTFSVNVSPTVTTVYSVTGADITGCSYTKTVSLTVDSCDNVWPGDANSDGVADNLDILELGLHYQQTGATRMSVSNAWQGYQAPIWAGSISSGANMNHSDCNGDGVINNDDTLAIYNNYGLTHTFKIAQTNTVNPQLIIVPDQNMVTKGNWGTASVYLGEASLPISNINGVAFTVDFDNTLIEPNSIWVEYINSFIDVSHQNLHFRRLDFANGKLYTASTHTVSNNVSGFGKIVTLHYQIKSSLSTDDVLNIGLSQANLSDASGVINPLTSGTGTLMAIGASVGIKENLFSGNVLVSPNPTTGFINITSTNDLHLVEVTTVTGQVLLKKTCSDKTHQLQLNDFAEGVYFVKVSFANGSYVVKKIVKQ